MRTCICLRLLWLLALTIVAFVPMVTVGTNIGIDFVVTMVTFATTVTSIHWQLWLPEDASSFLL